VKLCGDCWRVPPGCHGSRTAQHSLYCVFQVEACAPAMDLSDVLHWVMQHGRPLLIAVVLILIVTLLLRPVREPPRAAGAACSSSQSTGTPPRQAVSISTSGVLLEFRAGSPQLLPDAIAALVALASRADIYLITQLEQDSDAQEKAVLELLDGSGIFASGRCDRRKVVFCSTEDGRGAICRQLEPSTHIDTSPKIATYLTPHVHTVVLIGSSASPTPPNVSTASSLAQYVARSAPPVSPSGSSS